MQEEEAISIPSCYVQSSSDSYTITVNSTSQLAGVQQNPLRAGKFPLACAWIIVDANIKAG